MEQDNSPLRIQDGTEQIRTFPSEQVRPATVTINQEKKSFTDKDKAILRSLLLDLIFSEPRVKGCVE